MRQVKVSLRRVKLNRQGYEVGRFGSYYGVGAPLYRAGEEDSGEVHEFRADTRDEAVSKTREWLRIVGIEAVFHRVPAKS